MMIYIGEHYAHESRYENYQLDMLYLILNAFTEKDAKIPRYSELQEKALISNTKVTKQSVKNRFSRRIKELNGAEILDELINASWDK